MNQITSIVEHNIDIENSEQLPDENSQESKTSTPKKTMSDFTPNKDDDEAKKLLNENGKKCGKYSKELPETFTMH